MHVTTHIEGRKDDKLLSEIGGNFFPYVVALSSEGKVIAQLDFQKRSVDGFRDMMKEGRDFLDLKAKVDKGDNAAKIAYFPKAVKLGQFKLAEARKFVAGIKNVPADSKKEIDGLLAGLEMDEVLKPLRENRDPGKRKELQLAAGRKMGEMDKAGTIPWDDDHFRDFYALMVIAGEEDKNIAAMERGLAQLKERLGEKMKRFTDQKEAVLQKLKEEKEGKKDEPKDEK